MEDYKLWVEFRNQKAQRKQILKRIFSVMDRARLVAELTGEKDPKIVFQCILRNLYKKDKKKFLQIINQYLKPRVTYVQLDIATNIRKGYRSTSISRELYRGGTTFRSEVYRLYPLAKKVYDKFAHDFWVEKGSPKFGKRKITGVRFGKPITTTIQKFGAYPVITDRIVGVFPENYVIHGNTGFFRKTKLTIGIED